MKPNKIFIIKFSCDEKYANKYIYINNYKIFYGKQKHPTT
jgi:hypothetical protein